MSAQTKVEKRTIVGEKVILLKISVYSLAVHRHCSKTKFYFNPKRYIVYLFGQYQGDFLRKSTLILFFEYF